MDWWIYITVIHLLCSEIEILRKKDYNTEHRNAKLSLLLITVWSCDFVWAVKEQEEPEDIETVEMEEEMEEEDEDEVTVQQQQSTEVCWMFISKTNLLGEIAIYLRGNTVMEMLVCHFNWDPL